MSGKIKQEFAKYLLLILIALGAGPAGAAIWQWSLTPANNGIADPTINWAVGMAPSAVDPSARAMMARIAEYRDDMSGALVTGGGPVNYTLTTNASAGGNGLCPSGGNPANGTQITATINVTNSTTAPFLAVDGCTSTQIVIQPGIISMPVNGLYAAVPYRFTFNAANTQWAVQGVLNPLNNPANVPIGAVIPFMGVGNAPSNYIYPVGQCLSTTSQSILWGLMGSPGTGGCAAGQFPAPDIRGRVVAMLDGLSGQYGGAGRLTSSGTGCGTTMQSMSAVCANGSESHTLSVTEMPSHTHANSLSDPGHTHGSVLNPTGGNAANAGLTCCNTADQYGTNSPGTTGSSVTGMSINNAAQGGNGAHAIVQPTIGLNYIMRIN